MPRHRLASPYGLLLVTAALVLSACTKLELPAPHQASLSQQTRMLLGKKGMTAEQPIFVRIFKAESELEVWKQGDDGHFRHFKTYPICHWSGALGPKHRQGDKQSPEGFYRVHRHQMNPNSEFHLSFNLGFPNAYDQAHGRTGDFLMVHGKCRSAGCYAMTDALMEEIYALAREAFDGGQKVFEVHAFPFRMTEDNMARVQGDANLRFWQSLKEGYDYFETARTLPNVEVCGRRYHVNVEWNGGRLDPAGACPRFRKGPVIAFASSPGMDGQWVRAPGPAVPPAPQPAVRPPGAAIAGVRYTAPPPRMSLRSTVVPQRDPIADLLRK